MSTVSKEHKSSGSKSNEKHEDKSDEKESDVKEKNENEMTEELPQYNSEESENKIGGHVDQTVETMSNNLVEPQSKSSEERVEEESEAYRKEMLLKIDKIRKSLGPFRALLENFNHSRDSNEFFYIDDNLLKNIETLDKIKVKNYDELKKSRKELIRDIYQMLEELDSKVSKNKSSP